MVAPRVPAAVPAPRPKVRLVFSHHRQDARGKQSEAGWPYLGYDHEARKKELLTQLQQACPGVEFRPATAYSLDDARKILQDDAAVDGYVAYMIGGWAGAAQTIAATGRPTLYVGDLYGASGEFLVAYPCLGYRQLNNDGLVGACEADLLLTTTMLALTYLVNRPGFISDPVLDTSTNRIIYAHCVAPNKVFGPQGPTNPFHIRSHAEDGLAPPSAP